MIKKINVGALALTGFLLIGCASTMKLTNDQKVPAPEGTVHVKKIKNDNTRIDVNVKHLANPQSIDPSKNVFVVWVEPERHGGSVQNVGALQVDKNLNGSLETTVPFNVFRLFITMESSPIVAEPTSERLLWTQVDLG